MDLTYLWLMSFLCPVEFVSVNTNGEKKKVLQLLSQRREEFILELNMSKHSLELSPQMPCSDEI